MALNEHTSDYDLVERLYKSDLEAFDLIFNRYGDRLLEFFLQYSKKFAKIRLSTTRGGGFNPDFCYASQIFFIAHDFRAKPRKNMTTTKGRGFPSYIK